MATGKELDLALRIRADGIRGAQALDNINSQVEQIGTSATATSSQLSAIGESADQQAARLKAMVAASFSSRPRSTPWPTVPTSSTPQPAPQLPVGRRAHAPNRRR
ncbi:hypothetical protein P4050_25245 [Pseudomonas aeruginosa]|nr:hypothetical protein [Pseudomonas aeruginosa]